MTLTLNFESINGCGVTLDLQGNLYAVQISNVIKKWKSPLTALTTGTIFAGGGTTSPTALAAGASAPATSMSFGYIRNIRMDTLGNMYLCGYGTAVLYKIDSTGLCTIVAGTYNVFSYLGDGGAATSATMYYVEDVAISALNGDLYIADAINYRIRRVDGTTHIISTYAGNGLTTGTDNVAATLSGINYPTGVALDAHDNLYIADIYNYAIRYVNKATGIITTVVGTLGVQGVTGDGGPATSATLLNCWGVTYDKYGMLWLSCTTFSSPSTLRMVDLTSKGNTITTVTTGLSLASHLELLILI